MRLSRALLTFALALLFVRECPAAAFFTDGFEPPFDRPATDGEAARFLNQATFGATARSLLELRATGINTWISQQLMQPATLARPFMEALAVSENLAGRSLSQTHRLQRWFDTAVTAPDQLRQKVAYALGQMIVVSDQAGALSGEPVVMAEWNDLLVRNAFGNYRTLLGEASRSPMMGNYLTHLRNRKFELTPRCFDQRPPLNDDPDNNPADGVDYHDCTGSDATNNGTMAPVIARYNLPSSGIVAPDENYARELMQLFTIGLVERNADFSPIQLGDQPVATYDQQMIVTLSRVLTGFTYRCSGTRVVQGYPIPRTCSTNPNSFPSTPGSLTLNDERGLVHPDRYEPMACVPRYHDTGRDSIGFQLPGPGGESPAGATLLLGAGQTIPGGTPERSKALTLAGTTMLAIDEIDAGAPRSSAVNCQASSLTAEGFAQCRQYCEDSLDGALDLLFQEPNTATMVARHLIQRLVTSNPSPAYIERVALAFADNGSGVRGDLKAVVRAVLQDIEARQPAATVAESTAPGRTAEPLLKLVQLWRSIGAVSGDSGSNGYRRWARTSCSSGGSWPQCAYQQRPLGAPSVFNFYEPNYSQPGTIAGAGLFSPEFQIINENTTMLAANDLYGQICSGWGSNNCHGALSSTPPGDRAYFPPAALDALPGGGCGTGCSESDDVALIDRLDLLLLDGRMSGTIGDPAQPGSTANNGMRGTLYRLLRTGITGSMGQSQPQDARRREILYTLHLIAVSPEFNTRR